MTMRSIVFALLLLVTPAAAKDAWHVITSNGFSVEIPAPTNVKEQKVDIGEGQRATMRVWQIRSGGAIYDVTIAEYPKGSIDAAKIDEHLDGARNGAVANSMGPLVGETKVVTKNVPLLDVNPQVVTVVVAQASERIDAYLCQLFASAVDVLESIANRLRRLQLCRLLHLALLPDQKPVDGLQVGLQGCHDIFVSVAKQPEAQLSLRGRRSAPPRRGRSWSVPCRRIPGRANCRQLGREQRVLTT